MRIQVSTPPEQPIRPPAWEVRVNGQARPDIQPAGIALQAGISGSVADLEMPFWTWEQFAALPLLSVEIYAGYTDPVFRGYIAAPSAQRGTRSDVLNVRALSPLAFLDNVPIRQATDTPGCGIWRPRNERAGAYTPWNLAGILLSAFDASVAGAAPYADIRMGSVLVPATGRIWQPIPQELNLAGATLRELLAVVASWCGDIAYRERHTATGTLLDVVPSLASQGASLIRLPARGHAIERGIGAESAGASIDMFESRNRVVAVGSPRAFVFTVSSDSPAPGTPPTPGNDAALTPAWAGYTDYPAWRGDVYVMGLSAAEEAVLANPGLATPGNPDFNPAYSAIFRAWQLPRVLWDLETGGAWPQDVIAQNGGLEGAVFSGSGGFQAAVYDFVASPADVGGQTVLSPVLDIDGNLTQELDPRVARIERYDEATRTIWLAEPALSMIGHEYVAGAPKATLWRARVDLALVVRDNGRRLIHDTTTGGSSLGGVLAAGLCDIALRSDLGYSQTGSSGLGLLDDNGDPVEYPAIWNNGNEWENLGLTPYVLRDDSAELGLYANSVLAAKGGETRESWRVTLPFAATRLLPGDCIQVDDGGTRSPYLRVSSVHLSCANPSTEIAASTSLPARAFSRGTDPLSKQMPGGVPWAGSRNESWWLENGFAGDLARAGMGAAGDVAGMARQGLGEIGGMARGAASEIASTLRGFGGMLP